MSEEEAKPVKAVLIGESGVGRTSIISRFVNNMYEDILSSKNKEEQLLYIITSLLKKEINNLDIDCKNINTNNIENIFLNNTPCGFIFQELSYKKDIQAFFKIIIIELVEKLELSFPSQEIIFDPGRIKDTIFLFMISFLLLPGSIVLCLLRMSRD